jgi:hypothetical protein
MTCVSERDLNDIGLRAARSVGAGAVEAVEVASGLDSTDEPAHFCAFLIDQERDPERAGLVFTGLARKSATN